MQGSLANASAAVTGLSPSVSTQASPPVPGQLFQSVSLPVDARVSEKFGMRNILTLALLSQIQFLATNIR